MIILRQKSFNKKYTEALRELPWWKRMIAQRERGFVLEELQSDRMADYMNSGFLGTRKDRLAKTLKKTIKNRTRQEGWVFDQAAKERAKKAAQNRPVLAPAGA